MESLLSNASFAPSPNGTSSSVSRPDRALSKSVVEFLISLFVSLAAALLVYCACRKLPGAPCAASSSSRRRREQDSTQRTEIAIQMNERLLLSGAGGGGGGAAPAVINLDECDGHADDVIEDGNAGRMHFLLLPEYGSNARSRSSGDSGGTASQPSHHHPGARRRFHEWLDGVVAAYMECRLSATALEPPPSPNARGSSNASNDPASDPPSGSDSGRSAAIRRRILLARRRGSADASTTGPTPSLPGRDIPPISPPPQVNAAEPLRALSMPTVSSTTPAPDVPQRALTGPNLSRVPPSQALGVPAAGPTEATAGHWRIIDDSSSSASDQSASHANRRRQSRLDDNR